MAHFNLLFCEDMQHFNSSSHGPRLLLSHIKLINLMTMCVWIYCPENINCLLFSFVFIRAHIKPIFQSIAAKVGSEPCCDWVREIFGFYCFLSYMIQDYLDVFLYFYVAQTLTLSNSWIALIFPTRLCLDVAMLKLSKALQL